MCERFTGFTKTKIVAKKQRLRHVYLNRKRTGKSKEYIHKLKMRGADVVGMKR
jgi:hypothetical protein